MKTLPIIALSSVLLVGTAWAEKGHQHGKTQGNPHGGGMMMQMMSHDDMTKMHQHMEKMHKTMKAIKQEKDKSKRHELMATHMEEMMSGMEMMNEGMSMHKGKKMKHGNNVNHMDMEKRMGMMEGRIAMMQMMMDQMMKHQAEDKKARPKNPKL